MKRSFRIISLLLILVMLFSLCAVSASAATEENVKQYGQVDEKGHDGFLIFGDSFSRGLGATEDYLDHEYSDFSLRNVTGAFPYLVADAVGCSTPEKMVNADGNYWPCCYPGQTLAATMDLITIEDHYYDADYAHNFGIYSRYDMWMLDYFRCPESVDGDGESGKVGNIRELIKRAGLIAVELGMGDVFYRAFHLIEQGVFKDTSLSEAERYAKAVDVLIEETNRGFNYWSTYYPVFIKALKDMNPDADIVILGVFNPIEGVEIADELFLPVGTLFSAFTATMNSMYAKWAKELGVTYVDISNVETYATQYDLSLADVMAEVNGMSTHPTEESHAYIARRILDALPTQEQSAPAPVTTNIRVDLGRYSKVSYVMVDGIAVKNYSMDGFVLNIPNRCLFSKNLTVAIVNEDKTLDVVTYLLSFNKDSGYSAYRLYGKNDVIGSAARTAKAAVGLVTGTMKAVLGMFM